MADVIVIDCDGVYVYVYVCRYTGNAWLFCIPDSGPLAGHSRGGGGCEDERLCARDLRRLHTMQALIDATRTIL
jgi:hypothetical protein